MPQKFQYKLKSIVMKKVFTFLIALAMVLVAFAQNSVNVPGQPTKLDQPNENTIKSDWYGNLAVNTVGLNSFPEGTIIAYRFAANELPAGATIEKIMFFAYLSYGSTSYTTNFTVRVYTGGDGSWLEENTFTEDLDVCGTVVAQQNYTATEDGDQTVVLSNPVTIPANQEVWIAVEGLGQACFGFQTIPDSDGQWSTTSIWKRYYSDDEAYFWVAPRWCANDDDDCAVTEVGEWKLAAYVNDGQAYVLSCDLAVYFFDPFQNGQNIITEQIITPDYEYDSLYVCFAYFNNGPDSCEMQKMHLTMYIDGLEDGEYLDWDYSQYQEVAGRYVKVNYGGIWGNIAEDGLEEAFAVMAIDEMADYGLEFPFDMCMTMEYNGTDPNLTNNHKCMTYDMPDGIQENANQNFSVYPNPANNVITVSNVAGAQISIYNLAGQEVASVASASANQAINVANLAEGMYVIRVANGNNVSTSKFSVVR